MHGLEAQARGQYWQLQNAIEADLPLWKASVVNVSALPLSPVLTGQQNISADLRD
jgi:hypothetical protein